jgi:hypothetical protein
MIEDYGYTGVLAEVQANLAYEQDMAKQDGDLAVARGLSKLKHLIRRTIIKFRDQAID